MFACARICWRVADLGSQKSEVRSKAKGRHQTSAISVSSGGGGLLGGGSFEFHVSRFGGGGSGCVASVRLQMVRLAVAGVLGSNAADRQVWVDMPAGGSVFGSI
jgi:hypothetical protein